jgi:transposase
MNIKTTGLDLAKSVFQAHGVDANGEMVLSKRLHRKQMVPCFSKLSLCLIGNAVPSGAFGSKDSH